jgi:hypothetical protein
MIYIEISYDTSLSQRRYQWHIGEPIPQELFTFAKFATMVQADGDELNYVLDNFGGLPFVRNGKKRVWRWYGDHAKFIVGNL